MNEEAQKIISLIKKSYEQPIIFHILHSHLVLLMKKKEIIVNNQDLYTKILIISASENNLPNQGLEIKIIQELKILKQRLISNEIKYRLNIICYYMLTRPVSLINNIIIFGLVSKFLEISDYLDGLIITILNKIITGRIYGLAINKKIKETEILKMIEIISQTKLSEINKIKSLILFSKSNFKPHDLSFLKIKNNLYSYKCLEYITFFVKFTENSDFIKEILPKNSDFIENLKNYMKRDFILENSIPFILSNTLLEDNSLYDKILSEFKKSTDKKKFVSEIIEFVSKLN